MRAIRLQTLWSPVELLRLFYPPLCAGCGRVLLENETAFCLHCEYTLKRLHYAKDAENPVEQLFWGRVAVHRAGAYMQFVRGGVSQHLLHALKYRHAAEVGVELGRRYGQELKQNDFFGPIDYLVPVPLHPSRQRKRGYNQSERIAHGMAQVLDVDIDTKSLVRKVATDTQTHKGRLQRFDNVEQIFALYPANHFQHRHVVVVDDVVTTGATIEACVRLLLQVPDCRVSVAALAKA